MIADYLLLNSPLDDIERRNIQTIWESVEFIYSESLQNGKFYHMKSNRYA